MMFLFMNCIVISVSVISVVDIMIVFICLFFISIIIDVSAIARNVSLENVSSSASSGSIIMCFLVCHIFFVRMINVIRRPAKMFGCIVVP